ncbi:MAG: hypothetical protein ACPL1D_01995 [Microgenomates group bacterium]
MKKIAQIFSFTWLKIREYCDPAFEIDPWGFRELKNQKLTFGIRKALTMRKIK